MKTGREPYPFDQEWQERRNGDPFEGTQPWTQVQNAQGTQTPRSRSIPPAFRGGNKYQSPPAAPVQTPPQAQPVRSARQASVNPYQSPVQPPYQAPAPNPYQQPVRNPYQAPVQNPYQPPVQNPYTAPGQNPYQAPAPNPYAPPVQNPYQPPAQNPYQAPAQNPYAAPAPNPYQAPSQDPYQPPASDPRQAPPQSPYTAAAAQPAEGDTADTEEPAGEETKEQKEPVKPAPPSGSRATPPTGVRPKPVRKTVYIAVTCAVLAVTAVAVFLILRGAPQAFAYVQSGVLSTVFRGDALIVRNETVYTQEGVSRIDYVAEEGAMVQRGENVCLVYSSGFSEKELTTLQNYRRQIKEYHKTLVSSSATKDLQLERLESSVLTAAAEIQNMVQEGRGSLVAQEGVLTEAMQARQLYLKQKYPDDQKLARLYEDENTQLQRISSWTKQYAASASGLVSFYTDGYETALNLNNYADYTPTEVRAMLNGRIPTENGYTRNTVPVYRLVRQGSWVVLMLCENRDWVPVKDRTYKMLLEGFESTVVNATVETFTQSGGELLLRLRVSGNIDIGSILYMRSCSVMIGESVDSLMVPHRALYTRQGRIGVVIATESGEYWTAVEVVSDDGTTAHIVPENSGILYPGVPVLLF